MALSFPLSVAALADLLRIESVKFSLEFQQETSGQGNGEYLAADMAPARWMAEITTAQMYHAEVQQLMAVINALQGGTRAFYLYNPVLPYPQADPDGSGYGSSAPKIDTVSDSFNTSFTGFDVGYVLAKGDFLSVAFGTPVRTYLGQLVEGGTADGAGGVGPLAVTPALPAGVASGDAVTVLNPSGKFKLVPNSAYPTTTGATTSRITFQARQTYEAD